MKFPSAGIYHNASAANRNNVSHGNEPLTLVRYGGSRNERSLTRDGEQTRNYCSLIARDFYLLALIRCSCQAFEFPSESSRECRRGGDGTAFIWGQRWELRPRRKQTLYRFARFQTMKRWPGLPQKGRPRQARPHSPVIGFGAPPRCGAGSLAGRPTV